MMKPDPQSTSSSALKSLGEYALSSLAATAAQFVLRMARNVLLTRLLGPSGRGIYGLLSTLPGFVVSFGNLGFGLGSFYLVAKRRRGLREILGNSLLYLVVQGAILTVVGYVVLQVSAPIRQELLDVKHLTLILLISIPLLLAYNLSSDLLSALKEIHFANLLQVTFAIFPLVVLLLLWWLTGNALMAAIWAWLGTNAGIAVLGLFRVYRRAAGSPKLSYAAFREAISFGLRGNFSMWANAVVRRIDVLFVAHYAGMEAVGYYAASVSIAEIILALPDAISGPFLPLRLEMAEKEGRQFSPFVLKYMLAIMGLICFVTAITAKGLILILYGSAFLPSLLPLLCLLPGIVGLSLYQFLKADLYHMNRPGLISWVAVFTMICNLILNVLLIPRYGAAGAAVSSSLCYLLSTALLLYFVLRHTGVSVAQVLILRKADILFLAQHLRLWYLKRDKKGKDVS
jgi:O-antigen/teichoic acid export membrane protein